MPLRYWATLSATIVICFGVQALVLKQFGGRALKSESNYFSSLGRIQAGAQSQPLVMAIGSSITGRLPDSLQGFENFSNMGCDGGNAVDTLRAMDRKLIPSAPWIFVEANTLYLALDSHPSDISLAMEKPWFQAGIRFPAISAHARPSAFFYSILLKRKIGSFDKGISAKGFETGAWPMLLPGTHDYLLATKERSLVDELCGIIGRLHASGCNVIFVWLPPKRVEKELPPFIEALIRESGSFWWDLGDHVPIAQVKLTDRVHMDPSTAAKATGDLLLAVEHLSGR